MVPGAARFRHLPIPPVERQRKRMSNLFANTLTHLHPAITHFPIVLLIASVLLDLYGRWQPGLRRTAWITLLLGTLSAIPAVITGIIAHFPYENTAVIESIERHEQLGLLTTTIFIGLTAWRWRSRRGNSDASASWPYLALGVAGLLVLTVTGMTGGNLVYNLGVGVKEIVR
jgi:uncharacterized membrane protein